jgi:hypothetical protein
MNEPHGWVIGFALVALRPSHTPAAMQPPEAHKGVAEEHATLFAQVVPHVAGLFRFVSHPSFPLAQFPNPGAQLLMPQTPAVHTAVPFAVEHATLFAHDTPQVAVAFRFVSQSVALPSQLPVPVGHDAQAPVTHRSEPAAHVSTGTAVTRSGPHRTRSMP